MSVPPPLRRTPLRSCGSLAAPNGWGALNRITNVRIAHPRVKPIAFSVCVRLVIEYEQRTVPNDRIIGGSEDAMRVAVSPNNVSRGFGHLHALQGNGPGWEPGP